MIKGVPILSLEIVWLAEIWKAKLCLLMLCQFPSIQTYMKYIRSLPINDTPEIFGLHDNANITYAQNETFSMMKSFLLLQPKTSGGSRVSREEVGLQCDSHTKCLLLGYWR